MTETKKIRVLIADDFKVLRDVIRLYLDRAGDMQVVDEAPDLNDALEHALAEPPDVIIMNDYLPPVDTAYAAALMRQRGVQSAILTISMQAQADLIHRAFSSGVNGFMHKDEISEYLEPAIRSVLRGERYLSPRAQKEDGDGQ
ncbi:MAG TPA: response regulator transcription factor [Anaerolineales bacterium]|nr:response regulator transcription factor [Anaerolineales bacterium]